MENQKPTEITANGPKTEGKSPRENGLRRYLHDCGGILRLGLPVLVSQIGMIVVGFADNIMVGQYSTDALASASFVNNLCSLPMFAAMGFSYGLTPMVGALFTGGSREKIGRVVRIGMRINLVFSMLLIGVMALVYLNLPGLGQPHHLLPVIRPYYLIVMAGMLPVCLFNVFAQWSYGIRNTSMPMWVMLGANVFNILGNYILIYGHWGAPELGLTGAGISTLTARVIAAVVIVMIFFRGKGNREYVAGYRIGGGGREAYGEVFSLSWPISLQMSFETAAFSGCAIMCGWIGAVEMAAFQIIVIVGTLGFCIYYAMATSVAVMVANAAGRNDRQEMRRQASAGYGVTLAACICSSLFFGLGARHVMGIFTEDPAVLAAAVSVIIPLVLYQLGDATQINYANALRGTGNVRPMMWIAFVSYIIVGLPASYLLAFPLGMGLYGIILSFSCSLFLAAALFLTIFLRTTRARGNMGLKG